MLWGLEPSPSPGAGGNPLWLNGPCPRPLGAVLHPQQLFPTAVSLALLFRQREQRMRCQHPWENPCYSATSLQGAPKLPRDQETSGRGAGEKENTSSRAGMDLMYPFLSMGSPPTSSQISCSGLEDPNSSVKHGTTSSHSAQMSSWPIWGD